ncbi:restriction endonuclease [Brevibacterium luteolum]|uniref:Restriction endonuclease n=1 Tax=Brevibacterium luteolum TaxID=199591 RepID=A0A2N6PEX2_9MICO|nr:restriction endonuclease [Brevibacterium luteolum]PMB97235.1 restriction endonuclease [Brevibacterium luteolum]
MSIDQIPQIEEFRPLVLRVLNDRQARSIKDIYRQVADLAHLSDEDRAQTISSGQPRYANRIAWACSGLFHAGLLSRPKRGWYEITDNGVTLDARSVTYYSDRDMREWSKWVDYQEEIASRRKSASNADQASSHDSTTDPLELLETGVDAANAKTETELRQMLQSSSPEFFEKAVIELLWAMGYGGAHGEKEHVGRTADGGIDGVISQDALGLRQVCIQAKRYQDGNNVGSGAIRDFYGALRERGADRGVFITSSKFTADAARTAARFNGAIVLIDGIRLTSLMLDYGIAVQKSREFTVFDVDENFFDDDTV